MGQVLPGEGRHTCIVSEAWEIWGKDLHPRTPGRGWPHVSCTVTAPSPAMRKLSPSCHCCPLLGRPWSHRSPGHRADFLKQCGCCFSPLLGRIVVPLVPVSVNDIGLVIAAVCETPAPPCLSWSCWYNDSRCIHLIKCIQSWRQNLGCHLNCKSFYQYYWMSSWINVWLVDFGVARILRNLGLSPTTKSVPGFSNWQHDCWYRWAKQIIRGSSLLVDILKHSYLALSKNTNHQNKHL